MIETARLAATYEILKDEQLKTAAEITLNRLGATAIGRKALEYYAFGNDGRLVDDRLRIEISGIEFENPIFVGAGWDEKGKAVVGLHALGFGGAEVGTVPLFGQYGNDKPRLWTINKDHSVGMNRPGFNSDGCERVARNLGQHEMLPFPLGINIGLNKLMPSEKAPWAHAAVIEHIYPFAAYIALGISSPNTKQVRGLQRRQPLTEITQAMYSGMQPHGGNLPLFYKIDGDQDEKQIYEIVETALENNVTGIIAINSTNSESIKSKYGTRWAREAGGLSGDDQEFRDRATEVDRFIYEEAGDKLIVIGVGGIKDTKTALEKIKNGASAVQVVTAIRSSLGRVAAQINYGLVEQMERDGIRNIREYVGTNTKRGSKAA